MHGSNGFGRGAHASHLRDTEKMKSSSIPSVRVEPDLRAEIESLLTNGETLSEFVETSVREAVKRRRQTSAFIQRGLESLAHAQATGEFIDADVVVASLEAKMAKAKATLSTRKR
jgi:predicted transcriptional regulator